MVFRPSIKLTLILIILTLLFMSLGVWQMDRKAEKQALFDRFDNAPTLDIDQALREKARFARVEAMGRYDDTRHLLLDNKIWRGRAGVHVLTPFTLADGRQLLVNRGWLPLPPDRGSLPDVPTSGEPRMIRGRLNTLPVEGQRLGDPDVLLPDRWPQLITYFESDAVESALGQTLLPWLLQLDAEDDSGFEGRQWQAAVMRPETHGAYALQWFALMAAAVIIWIVLGIRRAQLSAGQPGNPGDPADGAKIE